MSDKAPIMIRKQAVDDLDEKVDGYHEAFLIEAAESGGSLTLRVEDKETSDEYTIELRSIASYLGSVKRYIEPDVYESLSPVEPVEVAETILDTRDSGLRFYYYRPDAVKA